MATDLGTLFVRVGIRGVRDVTSGLQEVSAAATHTGRSIGVLDIALGSMLGTMGTAALGGLMRLPGMLYNAGAGAIMLSNRFESISVGLQAITGSASEAERKLAFIKRLAIPSEYTASQLAEAGMMIEGMGLRLERVLPLITKLTMGTRRTGEEYQRMAVGSLFGRLAQGIQPELEAMSAFGLSRGALAQFGAVFGPNGEMLSDAKTMLDALERLIETRFGRALELAANTGQAKLSALADMWEQTVARMGDALKAFVMPIVERLGGWLKFIMETGWLERFASGMAKAFGIAGGATANPIDAIMANALVLAEQLPQIMHNAAMAFARVMEVVFGKFDELSTILKGGTLGLRLDRMIQAALPDWMFGTGKKVFGTQWLSGGPTKTQVLAGFDAEIARRERDAVGQGSMAMLTERLSRLMPPRESRVAELLARFRQTATAATLPTDPNPELGWGTLAAPMVSTASSSRETARNTRQMADSLRDLRATVWGGGSRTRGAVSSVEAQIALARALGYGIG